MEQQVKVTKALKELVVLGYCPFFTKPMKPMIKLCNELEDYYRKNSPRTELLNRHWNALDNTAKRAAMVLFLRGVREQAERREAELGI